jgi:hypothetical protein
MSRTSLALTYLCALVLCAVVFSGLAVVLAALGKYLL